MPDERQKYRWGVALAAISIHARCHAFGHDVFFRKRGVSDDRDEPHVRDLPYRAAKIKSVLDWHLDIEHDDVRNPDTNEPEARR